MHPADVVRVVISAEQPQKIRDAPAGGSILALARSQWSRNQREKRTINERVAIDQKQSRAFWTFHNLNIKCARYEDLWPFDCGLVVRCVSFASAVDEYSTPETRSRSAWLASTCHSRRRTPAVSCIDDIARSEAG